MCLLSPDNDSGFTCSCPSNLITTQVNGVCQIDSILAIYLIFTIFANFRNLYAVNSTQLRKAAGLNVALDIVRSSIMFPSASVHPNLMENCVSTIDVLSMIITISIFTMIIINLNHISSYCFNRGVCNIEPVNEDSNIHDLPALTCTCPPDWTGPRCEISVPDCQVNTLCLKKRTNFLIHIKSNYRADVTTEDLVLSEQTELKNVNARLDSWVKNVNIAFI